MSNHTGSTVNNGRSTTTVNRNDNGGSASSSTLNRSGNVGTVIDRRGNSGNNGEGTNYRRPGDNGSDNRGGSNRGGGDYNPANNPPQPYGGYSNKRDFDHRNTVIHDSYRRGVWNRHVAPPVRPYRPRQIHIYHPVRPVGWRPITGIPIIDGILGLTFGINYSTSLSYLYNNGYYIDGFYDNVIYLRDVQLFGFYWPDVMMQYDDYNNLSYVQFIYSTPYADRVRLRRIYRNLCNTYGSPVAFRDDEISQISWYGGNGVGYVTLRYARHDGRYFTTISYGY